MAALFGILIGLALGLTGAGGSIFGVPLLHYGLGMNLHTAVSVSLLAVALVAGLGAWRSVRARLVSWPAVIVFGLGSVGLAPLGAWLGQGLAEQWLAGGFGLIACLVAAQFLAGGARSLPMRAGPDIPDTDAAVACRLDAHGQLRMTAPCSVALLLAGCVTGLLSGVFGVGGGFLIVPALSVIAQMGMHAAVGTSLVLIAATSGAGFAGKLFVVPSLPWQTTALYVAGGAAGMLAGQQLALRLPGELLQRVFAVLLLLLGAAMLIQASGGIAS